MDVTGSPEFRRPVLQMLLANQGLATPDMWRDNGFLAGWVAHNALVASGAEAWRRMLTLYNRNSDWDLSTCAVPTRGGDSCPDNAKRFRDFPTALREHLAQNGYRLDGAAAPAAGAVSPSFDCGKARTASEIEICRSPRLAEFDNILAAGYAFIRTTQGRPRADAIGIPYWRMVAQCEGDEACIAGRQAEEIAALAAAGAPVSLPAWASAAQAGGPPVQAAAPPPPAPAKPAEEPSAARPSPSMRSPRARASLSLLTGA